SSFFHLTSFSVVLVHRVVDNSQGATSSTGLSRCGGAGQAQPASGGARGAKPHRHPSGGGARRPGGTSPVRGRSMPWLSGALPARAGALPGCGSTGRFGVARGRISGKEEGMILKVNFRAKRWIVK
ncbi:unnamed protein product, partial [Urochloa humidicola]